METEMKLMEGEHIIFNRNGTPVFSNIFESQQERKKKIPYNVNVVVAYEKMMSEQFKLYTKEYKYL